LTIDDDLAAQIEELRRRKGLSMKNAVNILLREGLKQQSKPLQSKRFRTKTHTLGLRPGFDPTRLNQLADELEAEVFQEKHTGAQG
jgi:hypothetical protein